MPKFHVIAVVMAKVELPIVADSAAAAAAKFVEIAKYKMEQERYSEVAFDVSSVTPETTVAEPLVPPSRG